MVAGNIETILQNARQAIEQRDWEQAKLAYLHALGLRSDIPDVHYGLATIYFQLGELTSAAHHFREVTRLDPKRVGAYVNLGAVLNLLTEYDDAVTALRKAISLDPKRAEAFYNLGLVHRRKGQGDLSVQAYREALRLNPRMPDAHLNLANVYMEKQQPRLAQQHYEQALQLRPGWPKADDGLARARAVLSGEVPVTPEAQAAAAHGDLDRLVDPGLHNELLTGLHQVAREAEELGKKFQTLLNDEVEPAIKELSSCLLQPGNARHELDECILQFEGSLADVVKTQRALREQMTRLAALEAQFGTLSAAEPDAAR
jgi:Tfp pilus assembly protein PilF